ncbi:MAG: 50S ribosomal protein L9 [Alphaproteobacteria bacterium]|nr:50S ribosomal protein L9 [Alphaproteobacteria bacterium]
MSTQIILLERVENLGNMGDVVDVKPGYARNFLLPQKKALRASKENIAYFEAQKKSLEAENEKKKKEAEKLAKSIEGLKAPLIRQASEAGHLYGSVTSRDIAATICETAKGDVAINRTMVSLNDNIKTIGLFPIEIVLHPEVKVEVTINIARSSEEAKTQEKTGKALITEEEKPEEEPKAKEKAEKKSKAKNKPEEKEEEDSAE